MKMYLLSLGAGLLVGAIYGLMNVRSPAPPVIALIGLMGILLGEQAVPLVKQVLAREPVTVSWVRKQCRDHVFGELPAAPKADAASRRPT
ncbi:MAG: XapX domain-containing protein [Gammaproteobacteria bacterium]|jgi:XapX domain-containing protein|uniref:XapX domain-containing protein n=1 Tax=Nevskia sp. TaxID=1929292 RepID=UPI003F70EDA1|nr:XapX domain-containing protein [Gammaproteobacteria bacterium]